MSQKAMVIQNRLLLNSPAPNPSLIFNGSFFDSFMMGFSPGPLSRSPSQSIRDKSLPGALPSFQVNVTQPIASGHRFIIITFGSPDPYQI